MLIPAAASAVHGARRALGNSVTVRDAIGHNASIGGNQMTIFDDVLHTGRRKECVINPVTSSRDAAPMQCT